MNVRVLVNLSGGSPATIKQKIDFIRTSKYPDRFRVFANVDWDGADAPGWAERGGRRPRSSGEERRHRPEDLQEPRAHDAEEPTAAACKLDDPAISNPVWQACARLDIPVLIHIAEPMQFFSPIDYKNERWLELAIFPSRRNNAPGQPSLRDSCWPSATGCSRAIRRRATSTRISASTATTSAAPRNTRPLPNVVLEVSAVLYEFGRQPRAAREFFVKYQDRILFGKDAYEPREYPYYWRVFETGDEYFDYYRDYHAFWKLYGMELPDDGAAEAVLPRTRCG